MQFERLPLFTTKQHRNSDFSRRRFYPDFDADLRPGDNGATLSRRTSWTIEMMLNTTMILDLLRQRPGRYVQHDMGQYRMKEANGDDVTITENGRDYLVEPIAEQMDDLIDASKLVRDGSNYLLP
jgi:hypothetical protein